MKFRYRARLATGEIVEREEEFDSKDVLYSVLHAQQAHLLSLDTISEKSFAGRFKAISFGGRIKEEHKIVFARNLSSMIEAGLPLSRALVVMERQAKSKKLKDLIKTLNQGINEGKPLSDLLEKYPTVFSSLFISMVRAGEESGNMVNAFQVIANQLESAYKLKKKVKGAMMYPAIILSAMFIIGVLMLMFVVPTLTATFKDVGVELPLSTRIIIGISDALKNHSLLVFSGILGVGSILYSYVKTARGRQMMGSFSLKIPVIGNLVREVNAARTASTISNLLLAGVEVVRSIEITEEVVQNIHYKKVMREMREDIKKGGLMSHTFRRYEHLYPPLVAEMTAVGEETGKVADLLKRVGVFYEEDVEEQTKNMSTIIEPFLMVIIGVVVGFFALSMIGPMYSLSSSI